MKRTVKQWAKKAYELGYTQAAIRKAVDERGFTLPKSTLSTWIKEEKWKPLPIEQRTPHKAVFLEKRTVIVEDKDYFPLHQPNTTLNVKHGKYTTNSVKNELIDEKRDSLRASLALEAGEPNEPTQAVSRESDDIRQMNSIIKGYEDDIAFFEWRIVEMVKKLKKNPSAKELTGIVSTVATSKGINAGKEVNLKDLKREKQAVQLTQAIDVARRELVKARRLHAQTVETRAKIADMEARRMVGTGENEQASGLVAAMDRIADKLGSDTDMDD